MPSSLIYNGFKSGLMEAAFNLNASNTIKVALVNSLTPNASSQAVWSDVSSTEVSGTGYTAGGQTITTAVSVTGTTAYFTLSADVTWSSSTITATGAVIYDSTASNKLIAYVDFGGSQSSSNGNFTVSWSSQSYQIISLS